MDDTTISPITDIDIIPPLDTPKEEMIDGIIYKLQPTDITFPPSKIDPLEAEV